MKALLDTHAVVWAAENDKRLGREAARVIRGCKPGEAAIADVTLLEIALLSQKQRIELSVSLEQYLIAIEAQFTVLPVHARIAAQAVTLDLPQGDTFDSLIVATASYHRLPLLSRDRMIKGSGLVEVIW